MSDQGWNTPGTPPPDPDAGAGRQQTPPPSPPQQPWDPQAPPPPAGEQWGQQSPPQQGGQQWGQPPAQQQPGQQPWGAPPPGQQWGQPPGQASGGIDPKIAGILAYLFGWLGGLVVYLVNKDNFSRFHGAQSILLNVAIIAVFIVLGILGAILGFVADFFAFIFFTVLYPLLGLGILALVIYLMVSAYGGKKVSLPVIGPMAEQWANK